MNQIITINRNGRMTSKMRNWNAYEVHTPQQQQQQHGILVVHVNQPKWMPCDLTGRERDSHWQFVALRTIRIESVSHTLLFLTRFSQAMKANHTTITWHCTTRRRVPGDNVKSMNTVVTHNNSCAIQRFRLPICTTFSSIFTWFFFFCSPSFAHKF